MNWDILGSIGEVLGALAVVGSLLYVGRQFRHSSTHALHGLYQQAVGNFSANRENAELMYRGNNEPTGLSPVEAYHYGILLHDLHNAVSINWEQYQRGYINEEAKDRLMRVAAYYISTPGGKAWWAGELAFASVRSSFPNSYVEAVEKASSALLEELGGAEGLKARR